MQKTQTPKRATWTLTFLCLAFISISISIFFIFPRPTLASITIYTLFFLQQFLCAKFMPGKRVKGLYTDIVYNLNGLNTYLFTIALFFAGHFLGLWKLTIVYDHLGSLISTANLAAWILWLIVFYRGWNSKNREPYEGLIREIWFGAELNPSLWGVDCKVFFDGRPSLLGWVIVTISFAAVQYEKYGKLSTPMWMFVLFSFIYVFDFFWGEHKFITTWDVIQERFGFMLCWGDVAFMPFYCSLQALYLIQWSTLPLWAVIGIIAMWTAGFLLLRLANEQKDSFKRDPTKPLIFSSKPPRYIDAGGGKKILASGFWSWSRHPNFFGELLNSAAFCLMCGFDKGIVPYVSGIMLYSD